MKQNQPPRRIALDLMMLLLPCRGSSFFLLFLLKEPTTNLFAFSCDFFPLLWLFLSFLLRIASQSQSVCTLVGIFSLFLKVSLLFFFLRSPCIQLMRRSLVLNPYQFSNRWIICSGLVLTFSFWERIMLKLSYSSFLKSSCISKVVISMPWPGTQSISSKIKLGWNSRLSSNFRTIVDKLRVSLLMEAVSVQISISSFFLGSSLFLIGFISSSVDTLEPAFSFLHLNLPWERMRWLTWWRIMIWWVPLWKCMGAIEVLLALSRMILLILATVFWKLKYWRRCSASALRYWDSRQLMRLRGLPCAVRSCVRRLESVVRCQERQYLCLRMPSEIWQMAGFMRIEQMMQSFTNSLLRLRFSVDFDCINFKSNITSNPNRYNTYTPHYTTFHPHPSPSHTPRSFNPNNVPNNNCLIIASTTSQ